MEDNQNNHEKVGNLAESYRGKKLLAGLVISGMALASCATAAWQGVQQSRENVDSFIQDFNGETMQEIINNAETAD